MATGDGVLALAVQKLTDFIINEVDFLIGIEGGVIFIRDELNWMGAFLADVKQNQAYDQRIRVWEAEIKTIALSAQRIIDDYYMETNGKKPSYKKLFSAAFFQNFSGSPGKTNVYDIGKEIIALKERLCEITRRRETYGINNIDSSGSKDRLWDPRRTTPYTVEKHFVGFDEDIKVLEERLDPSDLSRNVISIVGMGGSGKTTLARKLYNTNKSGFEHRAWVCVSQEWDPKDLLEKIIKSFNEKIHCDVTIENMNGEKMERHLRNLLEGKRYLLVIDDTWHEDIWQCLSDALPDENNGSRVIITTRNKSVIARTDTYIHELKRLPKNESWELFCKKAFSDKNGVCPPELKNMGEQMVSVLDGLPLAINVLGGLLSRKEPGEWREIQKYMVQTSEGQSLEGVAESYIKELNARSLIQVTMDEYKSNATFHVDFLLRELAASKAKAQGFFHIHGEPVKNPAGRAKKVAFRSGFEKYYKDKDESCPQVHSLSFLKYHKPLDDRDVTALLGLINKRLKSLKVLDLEGVEIHVTPKSKEKLLRAMGKLIHLRYLGFPLNFPGELPESIGNMQDLQALDVFTDIYKMNKPLSRELCKLKQLRHLSGDFVTKEGDISLEELTNLHFLEIIDISGWLKNDENDEDALTPFSVLPNIRVLSVSFENAKCGISIEPLLRCRNLVSLMLIGSIKSLPIELHESLPSLGYLFLFSANILQDPLPALRELPNLLVLHLTDVKLERMIITSIGFKKLVTLSIRVICEDMDLQIEEEALTCLRHIRIDHFEKFTLPERFKQMKY